MSKSLKYYLHLSARGMDRDEVEERLHAEMSSLCLVAMILVLNATVIGWLILK